MSGVTEINEMLPLVDGEFSITAAPDGVVPFNPNATIPVTKEASQAAKQLLAIGIQLAMLSQLKEETPADRKFAASVNPILTTIIGQSIQPICNFMLTVTKKDYDPVVANKYRDECLETLGKLLNDAELAAIHVNSQK